MTPDFHRIRRLPPYIFEEVNRLKARLRAQGIDIIAFGTDDADRAFLEKIASRSDLAVKVSSAQLESGIAGAARMLPAASRTR